MCGCRNRLEGEWEPAFDEESFPADSTKFTQVGACSGIVEVPRPKPLGYQIRALLAILGRFPFLPVLLATRERGRMGPLLDGGLMGPEPHGAGPVHGAPSVSGRFPCWHPRHSLTGVSGRSGSKQVASQRYRRREGHSIRGWSGPGRLPGQGEETVTFGGGGPMAQMTHRSTEAPERDDRAIRRNSEHGAARRCRSVIRPR